jgi:hypothetical protein
MYAFVIWKRNRFVDGRQPLSWDYFTLARDPGVSANRFAQADFVGTNPGDSFRGRSLDNFRVIDGS